jgi:hypothetical protein
MSKHTPGPWVFTTERGDNYITGGGKTLMCDTQYYPWCPDDDADWRLIAAAPDLLEALEEMLEVHGVRWEHVRGDSSIPSSWVELSDKARAAIRNATGETA